MCMTPVRTSVLVSRYDTSGDPYHANCASCERSPANNHDNREAVITCHSAC